MTRPIISPKGSIVVLTGAGISQESGLDTFRCAGGIWSRVRLEDVATPQGFERDPELVQRFYNDRRRQLAEPRVQPNPAHHALARLEREWPGGVLVVTQNIDDLHERAGSTRLIHMHGELRKVRCLRCEALLPWDGDVRPETACPHCRRTGALRPDVVWFGEIPLEMDRIYAALDVCALFVSIGTSGHVYPAAGFVSAVRQRGRAHTAELNLDPSEGASLFQETRYGPASDTVPAFVDDLLASLSPPRVQA
jgi:NAD-dependent protein deacetylases, SIR2 family